MKSPWPRGFVRIPSEDWIGQPIDSFAVQYDLVGGHGWYSNLDPTLEEIGATLREGHRILDYSGGTGILARRLLQRLPDLVFGVAVVDSSAKFLRLALETLRGEERAAFRLIRYLKEEKRLQFVDEVLDLRFDALISTNAIHLYYDLEDTLQSWRRVLRPGSRLFIQSGNIRNPEAESSQWIIDETVEAIHRFAVEIVRRDQRFAAYRPVSEDEDKMKAYEALRRKYFLPPKPVTEYVEKMAAAGFADIQVKSRPIEVAVSEWGDFLTAYHEGILGWVGGAEKIEGKPPGKEALADRLALLQAAIQEVFKEKESFNGCWTYLTATARLINPGQGQPRGFR